MQQLARHGARVVVADRNAEGATAVAAAIGERAEAATIDVTDSDAVQRAVDDVASRHGRLDYMFNNAGIAVAGELRFLTLADWSRLLDVNLRGVIHGVAAAYPLMVKQGFGHIVNTASAAGLGPVPGLTIYATTKHAVVGLSISLRGEAVRYGVKVSVVCPGFVDTPLLQNSPIVNIDREAAMKKLPTRPVDPMVAKVLQGVARNRALIVTTPMAHVVWRLYRLFPEWTINFLARNSLRNPVLASSKAEVRE
ncbi:MAG TPA: SDR family oxidoreductase [Candidatus Acidoferrales bacterium]|nr:SDR family oxidoreductase [Candidatus Acidoferrales bacterium]